MRLNTLKPSPGSKHRRKRLGCGESSGKGMRVTAQLRELATFAGLSMLEAHRALHQLFERKLVALAEDVLTIPDREALSATLDIE